MHCSVVVSPLNIPLAQLKHSDPDSSLPFAQLDGTPLRNALIQNKIYLITCQNARDGAKIITLYLALTLALSSQ